MKDGPNLAAIKTRKKSSPATQKEEKEIRKKIVKTEEKVIFQLHFCEMFDINIIKVCIY